MSDSNRYLQSKKMLMAHSILLSWSNAEMGLVNGAVLS
jgi:hypothetical protein